MNELLNSFNDLHEKKKIVEIHPIVLAIEL